MSEAGRQAPGEQLPGRDGLAAGEPAEAEPTEDEAAGAEGAEAETGRSPPGRAGGAETVGTDVLRPGTQLLRGQYTILSFLGAGGFGITYLARDSLERIVVIKECFPGAMCFRKGSTVEVRSQGSRDDFARVVGQFGTEARRLARLSHPNIVGVHQVFEDNRTSYIALDLIRGHDLLDVIEGAAPALPPEQIRELLIKLLGAVRYIHGQDILHRDISPDNILISDKGEPVLIDFGAAREEAIRSSRMLSAMHTVKDGYSPYEFYVIGSPQDRSSDLYSLGATFYHLISGKAPPDAQSRVAAVAEGRADPYVPLTSFDLPFDSFFVEAINKALAIFAKDRMASADDWAEQIQAEQRRAAALDRARQDKRVEASILRLVAETNETLAADRRTESRRAAAVAEPDDETRARLEKLRRLREPARLAPAALKLRGRRGFSLAGLLGRLFGRRSEPE